MLILPYDAIETFIPLLQKPLDKRVVISGVPGIVRNTGKKGKGGIGLFAIKVDSRDHSQALMR